MKPIGRFQWRVRTLLLLPALVAVAWCLAFRVAEWADLHEDYRHQAALHAKGALSSQTFAESPIPTTRRAGTGHGSCGGDVVDRPLTEAERIEERRQRERARRVADYHRTMRRKYALATWLPFLPLAPDPLPPY